jgi:REP element-mobilizing transposase RayT
MPSRRTGELHHFRRSLGGAGYFVTCCTLARRPVFVQAVAAAAALDAAQSCDLAGETKTYAFTVMPDHCHWLFFLGVKLALGRVVAKFKFKARQAMPSRSLEWQRDYYEHQLRPRELPEDYGLYIFLNPYRAKLIQPGVAWPWWWTGQPQAFGFLDRLDKKGSPPAEWVGQPIPLSVKHGE